MVEILSEHFTTWEQESLGQIGETAEHFFEVFLEQLLFIGFQDEQARLEENLVAVHKEVVPDTLQFPGVLVGPLCLHDAGVQGDEEGGAEETRVDGLVFEVVVEVRQVDADQSVQLVEHQFQHGQLFVEQMGHRVPVDDFSEGPESKVFLVAHAKEQKSRQKVHTLTVV